MKKWLISCVFLICMLSSLTHANVGGMTVNYKTKEIQKNSDTYVSIFLFDDKQKPITGAKPIIQAKPTYAVTLTPFYDCSTAEGREFCALMGNDYVGFGGAYVAGIRSGDAEETVEITVLSGDGDNAKINSEIISIGGGKPVSDSVVTTDITQVPEVGETSIKGIYLLFVLLGVLVLGGFVLIRRT